MEERGECLDSLGGQIMKVELCQVFMKEDKHKVFCVATNPFVRLWCKKFENAYRCLLLHKGGASDHSPLV